MRNVSATILLLSLAGCAVAPVATQQQALPYPAAIAPPGATQPPRARMALQSLVHPLDYPAAASGAQGETAVTLTIGVDGRVTGCTVTRSSGSSVLDSTTCRLLRSRARFTPAQDEVGNPVTGMVPAVISWRPPAAG